VVYLDNAATTWPKPSQVYDLILDCMQNYCANPGRSGHKMAMMASEKVYECRENICKLFNISNPECISFTNNTTEALNIGIKGILKSGDHVIITSMEHNSVLRPLMKLKSLGIEMSVVNADAKGRIYITDILKSINKNTKLIVTTHASNVIGTVMPIKEIGYIAKKDNIIYMVDAAQTAGVWPIDVKEMNIDILAFPGHKGLLGPQGTGGIYIREGLILDTLKEGGTGSVSESPYQPQFIPDRYESGTLNTPGIVGLNEGISYILKNGLAEIMRHERELTKYMLEGLHDIKKVKVYGLKELEQRVGVISINIIGKDCVDVCTELDEKYDIAARGGLHCSYLAHQTMGTIKSGTIRLSIGCFNTKEDIDTALEAINKIAK
jgi:cysteine desulfurase family protein